MMPKKLTVTLPNGVTATRRTEHAYTFAVAVQHNDGTWTAETWHSTQALAVKAATRVSRYTQIIPVNP